MTIAEFCELPKVREEDRLLSFALAVECADKEVWFSFAGHLADLRAWLRDAPASLPRTVEDVLPWLEATYARLNALFPGDHPTHVLHHLLQSSGMLLFVRQFVPPEMVVIDSEGQQPQAAVQLRVPKDSPTAKLLESGELRATWSYLVEDSQSSKCQRPYTDCPCSKYLDDNVTQSMRARPLALFWTNRPRVKGDDASTADT